MRFSVVIAAVVAVTLALPGAAPAIAPEPIPEGPDAGSLPQFIGAPVKPKQVGAPTVPTHPFMAPNGRSNIHSDAYMTDTNTWLGPLGNGMERLSTYQQADCASIAFDRAGRIVTICMGLEGPRLAMFDPRTLELLALLPMPPRDPSSGNPFTSFSGGGYFYLDNQDRAIIPTTTHHIFVVGETPGLPGFTIERDYDLTAAVPPGDQIVSALPDWAGRIWFVSQQGVVGTVDRTLGTVRSLDLGEPIGNSFSVDETGGVFIVSDGAMYRFDANATGGPKVTWRQTYGNIGVKKSGQTEAGSGTTPTLMGKDFVSITDNADPMNVVVYRRVSRTADNPPICTHPVFEAGAGSTDNSLIGTGTAMVVENNYGYTGPASTELGATTVGGFERVDLDSDLRGCHTVWKSPERAPSVVPKLSLANGLVYTYTKDPQPDDSDAWYLTAINFRTGATAYKRLAGEGLGYNNNYAPVTLGPDGTAYVGVLAGLVLLRDAVSPIR